MQKLLEIVNYNIVVRGLEIGINFDILESIVLRGENEEIGRIISSKGIERLKALYHFINGFNLQTNQLIDWFDMVKPRYLTILTACYIINAQVFSDGNHRTAELYLLKSGYYNADAAKIIISIIKEVRNIYRTDYTSTSSFDIYLGFSDYVNSMDYLYNSRLFKYTNILS